MKKIILFLITLIFIACGDSPLVKATGVDEDEIDQSSDIENSGITVKGNSNTVNYIDKSEKVTIIKQDTIVKHDSIIVVDTLIKKEISIRNDTLIQKDTIKLSSSKIIIKPDTIKIIDTLLMTDTLLMIDTIKENIVNEFIDTLNIIDTLLMIDTIKENIVNEIIEDIFYDERDGKSYKLEQINGKTWFKENLNFKTNESYCYDNKESNCDEFGRLYTYKAALNACPTGFHLPNKIEIEDYANYYDITKDRYLAGAKNSVDKFFDLNKNVYLRTNEDINTHFSCYFQASFNGKQKVICGEYGIKTDAFSVRCIKD